MPMLAACSRMAWAWPVLSHHAPPVSPGFGIIALSRTSDATGSRAQASGEPEADLADLAVYETLLAHKGIRGLVVCCDECQQDHYHDWDMLRANLLQLLVDGTVRPHEPAYDPEPDAYVTWDYCRGYADASLNEATSEHDGYR